jgi:hypothetical protein
VWLADRPPVDVEPVVVEPSPQSIEYASVWSSDPGSDRVVSSVVEPPSAMDAGVSESVPTEGATLRTITVVEETAEPPSSSDTARPTVNEPSSENEHDVAAAACGPTSYAESPSQSNR